MHGIFRPPSLSWRAFSLEMYNLATMQHYQEIPSFDDQFSDLRLFLLNLVDSYNMGKINTWNNLETSVNEFFTPEWIDEMDQRVPGWRKMASYANGRTLVHVMCVYLGTFQMPEFQCMAERQQQMMKWVILLHDLEKEITDGKRDHCHAFRSAVMAAKLLPTFGFETTPAYATILDPWSEFTRSATTHLEDSLEKYQDNSKIPEIINGIHRMFGSYTPAALIIKTILFHLSVNMNLWPPPTPLSDQEARRYFDNDLLPLLKVINLGDGEGWSMFEPSARYQLRADTLEVFEKLERLIAGYSQEE